MDVRRDHLESVDSRAHLKSVDSWARSLLGECGFPGFCWPFCCWLLVDFPHWSTDPWRDHLESVESQSSAGLVLLLFAGSFPTLANNSLAGQLFMSQQPLHFPLKQPVSLARLFARVQ